MKYTVDMGSGAMIYKPKFHKYWFTHSKVDRGGTHTHRQHGDIIFLVLFVFEIKESRPKTTG
jgi:hypothetical protein